MKRKPNKKVLILLLMLGLFLSPKAYGLDNISAINVPLGTDASKTISMDFKNAPLNDVLKIFSQQSGLNFIAASTIADKTVNLYLDKVPVEAALERILTANQLTYELQSDSNIFVVKQLKKSTKDTITRVYHLKNASVPSAKINSALSFEDGGGSGGDSGSGSGGGGEEGKSSSSGILSIIASMLTADGSANEDPRSNSLIITDIPSQFPLIEQTILRLDVRIPQVLIEVEMLDISKNTADLLGVKFKDTPVAFQGSSRYSLFPFNEDNIFDDLGASTKDPTSAGASNGSGYTAGTITFAGLAFTLQFLRTQSDTKNLARPRILTLDNETAEIKIATNEAIGLGTTTTGGASEATSTTVAQAERVETGVFLKVTPQVNLLTKEITMAIEPKVREARRGGTFGSGSGTQTFKDPEERGSKSILRVKDGETIIIGGLLRNDESDTRTQVPVLSKIPIVGAAFRHKDKSENQRELIIFISPHIVQENLASVKNTISDIIREQEIPENRLKEINKELSHIENQRY